MKGQFTTLFSIGYEILFDALLPDGMVPTELADNQGAFWFLNGDDIRHDGSDPGTTCHSESDKNDNSGYLLIMDASREEYENACFELTGRYTMPSPTLSRTTDLFKPNFQTQHLQKMKNLLIAILMLVAFTAFGQRNQIIGKESEVMHKYRASFPIIILPQLFAKAWDDRTHTQHIELHVKRNFDNKNIVGVKFATWRLFQPMGILWWDGLLDKIASESEFYPGYLRETGLGISYQRMLWKGLFATVEVLPQYKTYLDENEAKIGNGFKLYTSYHLGYHLSFGKNKRFFIEPQVHCQNWVFDTNAPAEFKVLDDKWRKYFLFEPNIYFGVNF